MSWEETSPGRWQRPIGANEAMIKTIGDGGLKFGKDVWSISVTANLSIHGEGLQSTLRILRDGWKALRFHHPSIATFITGDTVIYNVPDEQDLEDWAAESFVCVDGDESPADVIARLVPRRFAALYYLQQKNTIILHCSHWRTDGIGAMHLLNSYGQCVVGSWQPPSQILPWGEEVTRLLPSVEEALRLPPMPSPDIESAAKRYLSTLGHNVGALGAPYRPDDRIVPANTRQVNLCLPSDKTMLLEAACHRIGVEIPAAVHASVAAAAYSIAEETSQHKHYSSTMRQSLRPYLPPPLNGEAGAAGLYTAGYIVKVPSSQSWLERAKQYDVEYRKGATADLLSSRRQYALLMKGILENMSPPNPPTSGLDISWVPDVQALVKSVHSCAAGSLHIRHVAIGVEVLSRHLYAFTWAFNGQLEFNLVYNEAFYDVSLAMNILTLIRKHLVSNLLPGCSEFGAVEVMPLEADSSRAESK